MLLRVSQEWNEAISVETVGSVFFLRLVCPALITPQAYIDINETQTSGSKALIHIAKAILSVATNVPFQAFDPTVTAVFNRFTERNKSLMKGFFEHLTTCPDTAGEDSADVRYPA